METMAHQIYDVQIQDKRSEDVFLTGDLVLSVRATNNRLCVDYDVDWEDQCTNTWVDDVHVRNMTEEHHNEAAQRKAQQDDEHDVVAGCQIPFRLACEASGWMGK